MEYEHVVREVLHGHRSSASISVPWREGVCRVWRRSSCRTIHKPLMLWRTRDNQVLTSLLVPRLRFHFTVKTAGLRWHHRSRSFWHTPPVTLLPVKETHRCEPPPPVSPPLTCQVLRNKNNNNNNLSLHNLLPFSFLESLLTRFRVRNHEGNTLIHVFRSASMLGLMECSVFVSEQKRISDGRKMSGGDFVTEGGFHVLRSAPVAGPERPPVVAGAGGCALRAV